MTTDSIAATRILTQYVAEGRFETLPVPVVTAVKASLLDGLAVALAGSREPVGKIMASFVCEQGGTAEASVIGSGFQTSAANAALANGTFIHALDYDDGIQRFSFHCTSVLFPTIFALGEAHHISGKQAITAYAFGLELAAALFRATNRHDYDLGWHRTATVGTLAAAAAAARLLNCSVPEMQMAIGIAASEASGIRQNFGAMTKPLHCGLAARDGIIAALLARHGLTADPAALEGKLGFLNVFFGAENYQLEKIPQNLTQPFDYLPGLRIKKYPCCGQNTRPLDAILALIREHDLTPTAVESVECGINPSVMNILVHAYPSNGLEAKFSLEYCLAVALLDRSVGLAQFTDERVQAADVGQLIAKVSKFPDPSVPHSGGKGPTVTVRMKDGRQYSRRVDMPEGQSYPSASRDEQINKYRDCAGQVLSPQKTEACYELMENLEQLDDISVIMTLARA